MSAICWGALRLMSRVQYIRWKVRKVIGKITLKKETITSEGFPKEMITSGGR